MNLSSEITLKPLVLDQDSVLVAMITSIVVNNVVYINSLYTSKVSNLINLNLFINRKNRTIFNSFSALLSIFKYYLINSIKFDYEPFQNIS